MRNAKPHRRHSRAEARALEMYRSSVYHHIRAIPDEWPVCAGQRVQWADKHTGEIYTGTVKEGASISYGVRRVNVHKDGEPQNANTRVEVERLAVVAEPQPQMQVNALVKTNEFDALAKTDAEYAKVTEMMRDIALAALKDNLAIEQLVDTRNQSKVLQDYITKKIRARDMKLEAQNNLAEVRIRYERELGNLIQKMQDKGELAAHGGDRKSIYHDGILKPITLPDLNISHNQSKRWQDIAALPDDRFEAHIAEAKENGYELTSASVQRHGQNWRKQNGVDEIAKEWAEPEAPKNKLLPLLTSDSPEWYTPQDFLKLVTDVMGEIDLDPCSNSTEYPNVPAKNHYTQFEDGLSREWEGRVYMNPPYGREIEQWVQKVLDEFKAKRVTQAVLLLPARTDTQWFRLMREFPKCFIHGRLKFSGHDNSAPFPNVAVNIGCDRQKFMDVFSTIGDVYELAR